MPVLTTNLWKGEPNTKVPAISHFFSYRVTGAVFNANGTTIFPLPSNYNAIGQNSPVTGVPSASAPTSTPNDPNSEPQFLGAVFVPTNVMIRNMNGFPVAAGAAAAGTATLQVFNPNVLSVAAATGVVTRAAGTAANAINTYASWQWTASTTGEAIWSQEAVWDITMATPQLSPTWTPALAGNVTGVENSIAETSASAPGLVLVPVRFGLGDSMSVLLSVNLYAAGGTNGATATAFTVDTFGYWVQGI